MKALLFFFIMLELISGQNINRPSKSEQKTSMLVPVNFLPRSEFIFQTLFGMYHCRKRSKLLEFLSLIMLSVYSAMVVSLLLKKRPESFIQKHTSGKDLVLNSNTLEEILEFPSVETSTAFLEEAAFKDLKLAPICNRLTSVTVYPAHLEYYFKDALSGNDELLMKYEWARYASFKTFPSNSSAMPSRLASAGFYYIGPNDAVQCFSCKLVYSGWKDGDCPLTTHRRLSPDCSFLYESIAIHEASARYNGCANHAKAHAKIECSGAVAENHSRESSNITEHYKHPQYKEFSVRFSSFTKWYCSDVQDPRDLAEAGFFFAGFGDCVRCFCCGLGLRNWEYGDGPWQEHARWATDCSFLRRNKSQEFIQQYKENKDDDGTPGGACAESKSCPKEIPTVTAKNDPQREQDDTVKYHSNKTKTTSKENHTIHQSIEEASEQLLNMGFEQKTVTDAVHIYRKEMNDSTLPTCSDLLDIIASTEKPQDRGSSIILPAPTPKTDAKPESKHQTLETFVDKSHPSEKENHSISSYDNALSIDCLQDENRRLREQLLCKICMDKDACVVLLPCGHMISCEACSPALRKCAVCRQKVKQRVKAFLS